MTILIKDKEKSCEKTSRLKKKIKNAKSAQQKIKQDVPQIEEMAGGVKDAYQDYQNKVQEHQCTIKTRIIIEENQNKLQIEIEELDNQIKHLSSRRNEAFRLYESLSRKKVDIGKKIAFLEQQLSQFKQKLVVSYSRTMSLLGNTSKTVEDVQEDLSSL